MARLAEEVERPEHALSVRFLGGSAAILSALARAQSGPVDEATGLARFAATMRFRELHGLNDAALGAVERGPGAAMSMHSPLGDRPPVARLRVKWLVDLPLKEARVESRRFIELSSRLHLEYGAGIVRKIDLNGVDPAKCIVRAASIAEVLGGAADHYYPCAAAPVLVQVLHCPEFARVFLLAAIRALPQRALSQTRVEVLSGEC